jgi:hypothetical protein
MFCRGTGNKQTHFLLVGHYCIFVFLISETMKIIEVATKEQKKEFLEFPKRHYKNDPNWICPLDAEINGIFNPQVNKKFQHGEAIRWLLVDENSKTIGRIAAFYDKHIVNHFKFPTGGCGFSSVSIIRPPPKHCLMPHANG